jgi:hypothetical protein
MSKKLPKLARQAVSKVVAATAAAVRTSRFIMGEAPVDGAREAPYFIYSSWPIG